MNEAVIVATARTPIGRAYRGALNNIKSPTLLGHAIHHAVQRAGIDGAEVDDLVIGTVLSAGTAGMNLARHAGIAAGLPVSVPGQTMDRQCSSGLMAIATAAKQIIVDGMQVVVAGGHENISAVQTRYMEWAAAEADPMVVQKAAQAYMPMLMTAEFVARKYGISRDAQDAYALVSQQRTALAQQQGRFDNEIVPIGANMAIQDCRDQLGIDPDKYNVNRGGISIGHPYGMTGARLVGHALLEGKRRNVKYAVIGMCVGGGMGAAGLFEIV